MDWLGVLLTAVATVVVLWQLLKAEIKASEGRNGKAHDDIRDLIKASEGRNGKAHDDIRDLIKESEGRNRELIKESEGRNKEAHAELSTRINDGFNGLNATLMTMSNKMGFIRGWQERDERTRPQPGERDKPPGDDPPR